MVIITPKAEHDIVNISLFIAQINLDASMNFQQAIKDSFATINTNPHIGVRLALKNSRLEHVRMWYVENYRKYIIFYTLEKDNIFILKVFHSYLDYTRFT